MYKDILLNAPLLGDISSDTLKSFGDFAKSNTKTFRDMKDFIVGMISKAGNYSDYSEWLQDPEYAQEIADRLNKPIALQDGSIVVVEELLSGFWDGMINDDSGFIQTRLQNRTISVDDVLLDMALTDQTATIQSVALESLTPDGVGMAVADLGYVIESMYGELLPESKHYLVNLTQLLNDQSLSTKDKLFELLSPLRDFMAADSNASDIELVFATGEGGFSGASPTVAWAAGINLNIDTSTVLTTVVSAYKTYLRGKIRLIQGIGNLAIKLGKKAIKFIDETFVNGVDFVEIDSSSKDNVVDIPAIQWTGRMDTGLWEKWFWDNDNVDYIFDSPYRIETPYGYILLKSHGRDDAYRFSLQVFVRPIDPASCNQRVPDISPTLPNDDLQFSSFPGKTIAEVAMAKLGVDEGFNLESIPEGTSPDNYAYRAIQAAMQRFDLYMGLMYHHYHKSDSDYGYSLVDHDVVDYHHIFSSQETTAISRIFGIPVFESGYAPYTAKYHGMITGAHLPTSDSASSAQYDRYNTVFGPAPAEPTNADFVNLLNGNVWVIQDVGGDGEPEHPLQMLLSTCIAMIIAKDTNDDFKVTNRIDPIFVPYTRYTKPISPRYGIVSDSVHGDKIDKVFLGAIIAAAVVAAAYFGFKGVRSLKKSIIQAGAQAQALSRVLGGLSPSDPAYDQVTVSLLKTNRKLKRLSKIGSLFGVASTSLLSSAVDVAYAPSGVSGTILPSLAGTNEAISNITKLIKNDDD